MNKKYLWLIIAVVLSLLVGAKFNFPLAAWVAPIFLIRYFRESEKAGRHFMLAWLATGITSAITWRGATFFPPAIEPVFFLAMTPLTLLPYVIDRLYHRRFGSAAWVMFIFPVAATAVDFFSANGPFGTFGSIAYTQRTVTFVMQVGAVTGLWGITFVMNWFASLANHIWASGFKFTRLALTSAGLLALILGLSLGRTLLPAEPKQTAVIAGFSLPNEAIHNMMTMLHDGNNEAGFRQATDEQNAQQLEQIRTLAQDGADIVVLQEGAIMGMSDQVETVMSEASLIAKEENIYIVIPTFDLGKKPAVNSVHIIDPNGEVALTHVKYGGNMFEGTQKGDGVLQTTDTPYGKLSAIICWDADFPAIVKQAGEQNVDLLFIPSNDWMAVKDLHADMSTFRAVENGMSIFRQTGQGVSLASDAYGNIVTRVDTYEETKSNFPGSHVVEMPTGSVDTVYPKIGDAVGNVMLLGLLGLLVGLFLTRKKKDLPA